MVSQSGSFAIIDEGLVITRVDLLNQTIHSSSKLLNISSRGISISPDEKLAALGSDGCDINLYDINSNKNISTLKGNGNAIGSAIISARDSVVGNLFGAITISTQNKTRTLESAHDSFVYCIRRIDERRFATGAFDHLIRVRDFKTAELMIELDHGGAVFSLSNLTIRASCLAPVAIC